jgi:gliding motility-associated-like protein
MQSARIVKYILFTILFVLSLALQAQVVINEVLVSPPGGATTNANSLYNTLSTDQPPDNQEWIELYNTHPCDTADISCFTVACNMEPPSGSGYSNWGAFTFPPGTKIPPLGFLVLGGNHSQVPWLAFNMNYYRQTSFGTQWLSGDPDRWFLRDQFGWVALYNTNGSAVDAVYWDDSGNPGNLYTQSEYANPVITSTTCSGTMTLPAARNISGIEYAGTVDASSYLSFQRLTDGSNNWYSSPTNPTPNACNGTCVGPPTVNCILTNESCAGNDGSITVNITNGQTGPYTILWVHPSLGNSQTINNLAAGTYIVRVADSYNCFIVYDTVTLITLPGPEIQIGQLVNESCSSINGSISTITTGLNTPYSYNWSSSPPQHTSTLQNVPAGTYSVTVTDNLGCSASATASIINMPGPEIEIDQVTNEMCSASNGAISAVVNGGTLPLHFNWNSSPAQTTQNLVAVHAGNYTVTVTDDNGCTATASAIITNTPPPEVSFTNVVDETCHKGNGSAILHIEGGNPPYTYMWEQFPLLADTLLDQIGEGIYTVSVSDSFCTVYDSVAIHNIPGPVAAFRVYPEATTIETPRVVFYDESVGATEWNWDFGDWTYSTVSSPIHNYTDTGTFRVRLMIFDDQGCMDSISHEALIIGYINIFVPNAFSPNGDGVNDIFNAFGQNICDFEMYIYNRWGEEAFHSTDLNEGWNGIAKGKKAPDGVYSWIIWYRDDYRLFQMDRKSIKGHLTLLR